MLERATAPGDEMPADLDAETSSLREGWLAFGKLLQDAQLAEGQPCGNWKVGPRPAHRWQPLVLAVAIAASLLIAVGLTVAYRLQDGSNGVQPNPPTIAQDHRSPAGATEDAQEAIAQGSVGQPDTELRQQIQVAAVPDELKWDSSLDEQITAAAQAAALMHEDWYAQAGSLIAIERGLDEIKKDIQDGTL
jgi:hypothetical protein